MNRNDRDQPDRRPAAVVAMVVIAIVVGVALQRAQVDDALTAGRMVVGALAAGFATAGTMLAIRPATVRLGFLTLLGAAMGCAHLVGEVWSVAGASPEVVGRTLSAAGAFGALSVAAHLLVALPDGRLPTTFLVVAVGSAHTCAAGAALWTVAGERRTTTALLGAYATCVIAGGVVVSNRRYRHSRGVARQRMQWIGLALALWGELALIVASLRVLLDWPHGAGNVVLAASGLVAVALVAASSPRTVGRVDRLLTHAVSTAGLSGVVTVIYLVIVVGLGRVPTEDERTVLVLSMAAAALSAAAYLPVRERLAEVADRLVYGEGRDPGEALETFGSRLTRALPMDELLLQLAELCRKHLALRSAEVWTGTGGVLSIAASVPDRRAEPIVLGERELPVVVRSRVSGRGWAEVWLPAVLADRRGGPLRIVPMVHTGELFGLLVLERVPDDDDFTEEDDAVLSDLARQVALALHNSELDTALQETLAEVQRKNVELQESRVRIVAAGDAERRKFERNLHDGAQQHLVALAVKLRLIQRLAEKDAASALAMLEEARSDVLVTVDEVRALAHGLYPKVLTDLGLIDALNAAAARSPLSVHVDGDGVGRYPQEVEAAVYFCVLEGLQNAAKHAGLDARVSVELVEADGRLRFAVADDGPGFDLAQGGGDGQGFMNMADRLGALGGSVEVWSRPGEGVRIVGSVVVPDPASDVAEDGSPADAATVGAD